jgi:hypothetical protein
MRRYEDTLDALQYAFFSRGYGRWTSSWNSKEAKKDDPNTIDITASCRVHRDDEAYGPSPIKALLPLQEAYDKGGNQK